MFVTEKTEQSKSRKSATYTLNWHDVVNAVEFCPYEWASQLLAVGTSTRLSIVKCRFQEENAEIDGVEHTHLKDFHHGCRVTSISWSPETSLVTVPKVLKFCAAGSDHKIRVYTSDLKESNTVNVIGEHRDYVNAVNVHPDPGDQVASVSDDNTCRIWGLDGVQLACFPLKSPGMAVCWHSEEAGKLLVAEKRGVIRFYNVLTGDAIMSLDCGLSPLLSADWCPGNPLRVAALVGTDWFIFDTSRSSQPLENRQAHLEGGKCIRWSRAHDHLLATTGHPGAQLKTFNIKSNQVSLSTDLVISNGVSWHHHLPLVVVGGDKQLQFWMIDTM